MRVLVLTAVAVAADDLPPLPPYAADVALGFLEGFVSDQDDMTQCIVPGIMPVFQHLLDAKNKFVDAMKTHNVGELFESAVAVGDACIGIEPMLEKCDNAHSDVIGIVDVLKQIHDPIDLIKQVGGNLEHDVDNIENEAHLSFRAFRDQKYSEFGNHVGMLLHRLVVGKYRDGFISTDAAPLTLTDAFPKPTDLFGFGVSFVQAVLSKEPHLVMCALSGLPILTDATALKNDFTEALRHHNMTALTNTVKDVAHLCGDIAPIQQACGPIGDDLAEIKQVMSDIHGLVGFIDHIRDNLDGDLENIERAFEEAVKTWSHKPLDYGAFGQHLGEALRRLLIEKYPDESSVVV